MDYQSVGGLKVSRLGIGTVQFGLDYGFTKKMSQKKVDGILEACVEEGINYLDTAPDYGDSELKIGRYLKRRSSRSFIIATKLAKIKSREAATLSRLTGFLRSSVESSLKRLAVKRIDVLQLHQTDRWLLKCRFFWKAVRALKREGLFRSFGLSVYDPGDIRLAWAADGACVDWVQCPYNFLDRRFEELFPEFVRRGCGIISRSVFLKGLLLASRSRIPAELLKIDRLRKDLLPEGPGEPFTRNEAALLFALEEPRIQCTLVGVNSAREVRLNSRALARLPVYAAMRRKKTVKRPEVAAALIDPRRWENFR